MGVSNLIAKQNIVNVIDGATPVLTSAHVLTAGTNPVKKTKVPSKEKLGAIVSKVDAQKNTVNVINWEKNAGKTANAPIVRT